MEDAGGHLTGRLSFEAALGKLRLTDRTDPLQSKISRDPAARAAREAREPRHMPQFLQRGTTPQGAGADEEEFEG